MTKRRSNENVVETGAKPVLFSLPSSQRSCALIGLVLAVLVSLAPGVADAAASRYWLAPVDSMLSYFEPGERITPFDCPPFGQCDLQLNGSLGVQIDVDANAASFFDVAVQLAGQRPELMDDASFQDMMEERFNVARVENESRAVFQYFFDCGPFEDPILLTAQIDGNQLTLSGGYDSRACDGDAVAIQAIGLGADVNGDGVFDAADIDTPTDLNRDGAIDVEDRRILVEALGATYFGDANLDGKFNSSDLVNALGAGEYEDSVARNSTWLEGDWNGDAEFDSGDLLTAFQRSGAVYECSDCDRRIVVPEPSSLLLLISALVNVMVRIRRS